MSLVLKSQSTLIMAVITLVLAVFAVLAEALIPEEDAKLYTVPALYALILTSALTVATTVRHKLS